MIQAFVEKNRRLLGFCSRNIRSVGWLFIILAILGLSGSVIQLPSHFMGVKASAGSAVMRGIYGIAIMRGVSGVLVGVLILGLADVFRYLLNPEQKVSWILRHGDLILYAYAATILVSLIGGIITMAAQIDANPHSDFGYYPKLIFYVSGLLFAAFKIFVLVCVGPLVRRIVPVIEESMTLV